MRRPSVPGTGNEAFDETHFVPDAGDGLAAPARIRLMAKHSSHILEMARKGAEHRYSELKAEIALLVKHFPHLAGAAVRRGAAALPKGGNAAMKELAPRKRRRMSAKARAAISAAQKARWAKQKAGEKKK
jgi:hypothetical protein